MRLNLFICLGLIACFCLSLPLFPLVSDDCFGAPTVAVPSAPALKATGPKSAETEIAEYRAKGLPMVLDFGRRWCKPCRDMVPDVEDLRLELSGRVLVRYNDLDLEGALGDRLKVIVMPTQVYLNGKGQEVFRHSGRATKNEMLAKIKELGFLEN